jgi:G:T-mismatch repair DNA endonuclease (very short patch repair protein)
VAEDLQHRGFKVIRIWEHNLRNPEALSMSVRHVVDCLRSPSSIASRRRGIARKRAKSDQ